MKQRKEIQLEQQVINDLQKLADSDYRDLKPYMEKVLIEHSQTALKKLKRVGQKNNKITPTESD